MGAFVRADAMASDMAGLGCRELYKIRGRGIADVQVDSSRLTVLGFQIMFLYYRGKFPTH